LAQNWVSAPVLKNHLLGRQKGSAFETAGGNY
jgi:hypothetical protein